MPLAANNRILAIISYFSKHASSSFGELAARLGVSMRTVRNDIKQLNDLLQGSASIEADRGTLRLYVYQEKRYAEILGGLAESTLGEDTPERRQARLFGLLARATKPMTMADLAGMLFVSRATLAGDVTQLRKDIAGYGLTILGKENSGLTLDGDEIEIRLYLLERAYDAVYGNESLPEDIVRAVSEGAHRISAEESVCQSLMRYVTVMCDRFGHGHAIGALSDQVSELARTPEYTLVDTLVNAMEKMSGDSYPQKERLFVSLAIMGTRVPGDAGEVAPIELDSEVVSLMHEIIRAVSDELNVSVSFGDLTNELLYHIKYMLNRLRYSILLENPLLDDIRRRYPLEYAIAGVASKVIEEHCDVKVPDGERGYLAAYFGVLMERLRSQRPRTVRVAIVAGSERITACLIEAQLHKVLDEGMQTSLFTRSEVDEGILRNFDIVLSTAALPFDMDVPVIIVREVFDATELVERMQRALSWASPLSSATAAVRTAITGHLNEDHFFVLDASKGYRDGIESMAGRLEEMGELDEGFLDRLREREHQHRMAFGNGVALPHCLQLATGNVALALGVYPHPVLYGEEVIKVVFLLGVPAADGDKGASIIRYYDEIVSVSQDEELVDRLSETRDFRAAIRVLQG
ncbi:BglG family transcription antiterminator [Olsenella profusa]|uniref:Phosphoenolpyruvate-dependent sugar PTS family porter, EIIA 2 component n=1 Tax=Olsenella profusa F0195 TaxID=1125712 RepID=U2TI24_9ACTN|nr:BglG family transcription antiterminator [Olsenella profusa]ERL06120.1 phosphoenolpyruvate-dependent sugar PTS family porter, EIIA 2 component [Olsenella profusa F0195]